MVNMKKSKPFSLHARSRSIKYAFEGLIVFFKQEHNARIHLAATILVIGLSIFFSVSRMEAIALFLTIGLVWMSEIFNTVIEEMLDFISMDKNPQIKVIKDLSAAAVLIAALVAVITGCFIFIPKL